jgi:serine/threonine protein kinase
MEKIGGYTSKVDIWSLGCLFYEIACFESKMFYLEAIKNKDTFNDSIVSAVSQRYSTDIAEFISSLLTPNPKDRPDSKAALAAIKNIANAHKLAKEEKAKQKQETADNNNVS